MENNRWVPPTLWTRCINLDNYGCFFESCLLPHLLKYAPKSIIQSLFLMIEWMIKIPKKIPKYLFYGIIIQILFEISKNPQKTSSAYILRQLGGLLYGIPLDFHGEVTAFCDIPALRAAQPLETMVIYGKDFAQARWFRLGTGMIFWRFLGSIGGIFGDLLATTFPLFERPGSLEVMRI